MIIGVDFDNTIVCYDGLFHKLAVQQGLVPASVLPTKNAVRDHLRAAGQEDRWTELQGYVYGPGMAEARLYPGVLEFFSRCRRLGLEVHVISHRTRYPFLGPRYDLHEAARGFLAEHGFHDPARIGMPQENICFYETKVEKIARIIKAGCTHFIDDLPEVLAAPELNGDVETLLFDPNGQHLTCPGVRRFESWREAEEYLLGARSTAFRRNSATIPPEGGATSADSPPAAAVAALLAQAGISQEFRLTPLSGGANNRVYRVDGNGRPLLLKSYFHHADDPRDRLANEYLFSSFAWNRGIRCIAQPLGCDARNHLGLYEFIEGRTLTAEEIGAREIEQATAFFAALNRHELDSAAAALQTASEACFSLAEHLACVDRRVQRLVRASISDRAAAAWIHEKLAPTWRRVEETARREAVACRLLLDEPLTVGDRCLSPSDFGFHNAILAADDRLRFIDFEYAGWDDPAKTVCDFLCQPRLPVPDGFAQPFVESVLAACSGAEFHRRRVAVLLPVYRLKWCCIMMNEFLPDGSRRREFACDAADREEHKRAQLEKAERALQSIEV